MPYQASGVLKTTVSCEFNGVFATHDQHDWMFKVWSEQISLRFGKRMLSTWTKIAQRKIMTMRKIRVLTIRLL